MQTFLEQSLQNEPVNGYIQKIKLRSRNVILNGIQQSEIQPVGCCAGQTICANIADVYKVEEDGWMLFGCKNKPSIFY